MSSEAIATYPQSCIKCGERHDGSKGPGRRTWRYHEEARARLAGMAELPNDLVGPSPDRFEWSVYKSKESSRCLRQGGSLKDLAASIERISSYVLPGGDKRDAPFLSSTAYKNGRSTDENCEAIHVLWFDSDGGGDWEVLMGALKRSGLGAIFQQSTSRKAGHWHVGIPLTKPIVFQRGEWTARARYKLAYRHLVAVFSALAGFEGVGGHCGLDLCTDRLVQPMFPALKRGDDDDAPGLVYVEGGALDFERTLTAVGFDTEVALGLDKRQLAATKRRVTGSNTDYSGDYSGQLGPLGAALKAAGMLGRQKDSNGVHCKCPWPHMHSSKGGAWDAIYFPSSDTWWCPHTSCKHLKGAEAARQVAEATGPSGLAAYTAALAEGETYTAVEKQRSSTAIGIWLDSVKNDAPLDRILNALSGALVGRRYSSDFVVDALSEVESRSKATERVQKTVLRLRRKMPTAGVGWLRRTLGLESSVRLAAAISSDSGQDPIQVAAHIVGMGLVRGGDKVFLQSIHASLAEGNKLRSYVLRSTGCRKYGDKVKQFGREVGTTTKVCECLGCPRCFFVRALCENDLLAKGWTDSNGKAIKAWSKLEGRFSIHRVTGIPDLATLQAGGEWLTKHDRSKRIRIMDWQEGKPAWLIITEDTLGRSSVKFAMRQWAEGVGATYTREDVQGGKDLITAAEQAKLNIHVHEVSLRKKRDKDALLDWIEWSYRKRKVNPSRKTRLKWPTKAAVKEATVDANREEWDIDYELGGVTYTAFDVKTGYELGTSKVPHTIMQCISLAKYDRGLQSLLEPQDHEAQAILEAMHNDRCDRLGVSRIAEGLCLTGAGAPAQTWY